MSWILISPPKKAALCSNYNDLLAALVRSLTLVFHWYEWVLPQMLLII